LSLIPFRPGDFQEQLKTFDLVIFQDFGNRPWYHLSQYLDGIASYVRDGGALAVIGGEQAFSASDFGGTAIDSVLPVSLNSSAPPVEETAAQVRLTDAGRRHPSPSWFPGFPPTSTPGPSCRPFPGSTP